VPALIVGAHVRGFYMKGANAAIRAAAMPPLWAEGGVRGSLVSSSLPAVIAGLDPAIHSGGLTLETSHWNGCPDQVRA